jgi:hypothetical protein
VEAATSRLVDQGSSEGAPGTQVSQATDRQAASPSGCRKRERVELGPRDWRWTEGKAERTPELAADLVRLQPDLIVT